MFLTKQLCKLIINCKCPSGGHLRKGNNMRKIISILFAIVLTVSAFILSSCNKEINQTPNTAVATIDTAVNINDLQSELSELKDEYNNIIRIYDDSLEKSINTYCEEYLSFSGSASDNIEKIKYIVTNKYYNELISQTGHNKSNKKYEQSTGLDKLYYDKNLSPSDNIEIIALCKQTVIYNNNVTTNNVIYIFDMVYENDKWIINSTEII